MQPLFSPSGEILTVVGGIFNVLQSPAERWWSLWEVDPSARGGRKVNDGMFSKGILAQASHNIISFLSLMFPAMMFRAGGGGGANDLRLNV